MTATFRSFRRTLACGAAACLSLLAAAGIAAQNASLSGVAKDATGAVVPAAEIRLENQQTGARRTARTGPQGRYSFPQTPPGLYTLTGRKEGFAEVRIEDVRLLVNTPAAVDVVFRELEAVSEVISIEADAAQINTTDASIGNSFGTKPILQLPMNARNPAGLLSLQAGVTFLSADPLDANLEDIRNGVVNGARANQSNITLDGVDVNNQNQAQPFTSALRNTLDSIQEFRVVTTTANADMGRSSGAQVSLVTKSGTNEFHGSLYEFHRNTETAANDFFNNRSGVERAKLIRNVFGGSIGGPIKRNRAFFFVNYEGRRDASEANVVREVPSESMRQGVVKYFNDAGGGSSLDPDFIAREIDPLGIGPDPDVLDLFNSYPLPNDTSVGDGINTAGFRFTAPTPLDWNTTIAKLDWNLDGDGAHTMFLRGNLQDDRIESEPQFPGQPPNRATLNNSRGLAFGYNAVLSPTLVSTFRYGLTRQGVDRAGVQTTSQIRQVFADPLLGDTRSLTQILPVHTISEDVSWTKGRHQLQFGGVMRHIRNRRINFENSFHAADGWAFMLEDAAAELTAPLPDVAPGFEIELRNDLIAAMGILSRGFGRFNFDVDGNQQPVGSPVRRNFGNEEFEFYVQDTWQPRAGLTLTAGLRWSLMKPVREVNGQQVTVTPDIDEIVAQRLALAEAGRPTREAGRLSFVPRDSPEGKSLYPFHKKNFAPRFALAYSPQTSEGFWGKLFGGPGKTSIRAGFGMFYDQFGMGVARKLDENAFGLSSTLSTPLFTFNPATAPRFEGLKQIPEEVIPAPPPGGPGTPPDAFSFTQTANHNIRPPYTMNLTFSIGRELGKGFLLESAYVGRLSRRTLVNASGASQQANLRDPASGQYLFDALRDLELQARAGTPMNEVEPIAFFENIYSNAATAELNATQRVFEAVRSFSPDTGSALAEIDANCNPFCSDLGPHAFFAPQFWWVGALDSVGSGNYHSMQWTLRKRFSQGFQFDLNYTWSKSIDLVSSARGEQNVSGTSSFLDLVNNWDRSQHRGVSDFDMTHQFNANWVVELPFGRGKPFLSNANGFVNALLGGWQVSGLWRHTSGLPFSVDNASAWPTNWCCRHKAVAVGAVPEQTNSKNAVGVDGVAGPNVFDDPAAALAAFRPAIIGGIGQRNVLRGDGLFSIDLGIAKRFVLPWESHSLQFRAEAFNVTNSVSFRSDFRTAGLNNRGGFGRYSSTLVPPRVIQFGLRYEF